MVYDERNIMTPLVTVEYNTPEGNIIYPISSDGNYTGILANLDKEWVSFEYIYGDDDEA